MVTRNYHNNKDIHIRLEPNDYRSKLYVESSQIQYKYCLLLRSKVIFSDGLKLPCICITLCLLSGLCMSLELTFPGLLGILMHRDRRTMSSRDKSTSKN